MNSPHNNPPFSQDSDDSLGLFSDFVVDKADKDPEPDDAVDMLRKTISSNLLPGAGLHVLSPRPTQLPRAEGPEHRSTPETNSLGLQFGFTPSRMHHGIEPQPIGLTSSRIALPDGRGVYGLTQPMLRLEVPSLETHSAPSKPSGAALSPAYRLPGNPTQYGLDMAQVELQNQVASRTPSRQLVVEAPPQSAQRGVSGLFNQIRSLGDYILPGGAAWRGATPRRGSSQGSGRGSMSVAGFLPRFSPYAPSNSVGNSGGPAAAGHSTSVGATPQGEPANHAAAFLRAHALPVEMTPASSGPYPGLLVPRNASGTSPLSVSFRPPTGHQGVQEAARVGGALPPSLGRRQGLRPQQCYEEKSSSGQQSQPFILHPPRRGPQKSPAVTSGAAGGTAAAWRQPASAVLDTLGMGGRSGGTTSGHAQDSQVHQATSAPQSVVATGGTTVIATGTTTTTTTATGAPTSCGPSHPGRWYTARGDESSDMAVSRGRVPSEGQHQEKGKDEEELFYQQQHHQHRQLKQEGGYDARGARHTPVPPRHVYCMGEASFPAEGLAVGGTSGLKGLRHLEMEAMAAVAQVLSGGGVPQHPAFKALLILNARAARQQQQQQQQQQVEFGG